MRWEPEEIAIVVLASTLPLLVIFAIVATLTGH